MPIDADDPKQDKRLPHRETPLETAARLREEYATPLSETIRKPLPRKVFDAMWDNG